MRTEPTTSDTHIVPVRPRLRTWMLLVPALAILGITGGSYTTAEAQTAEAADTGPAAGFAGRRLDHVLDKVGATTSQRGQIHAIWSGLRPQLKTFRQQHQALRQQMAAALSAATVDPAAVEQLRQQAMGVANQISSTFTQGLVQTAQVLTPDQRKAAAAAIAEARGHFHHRRGPNRGAVMGQ